MFLNVLSTKLRPCYSIKNRLIYLSTSDLQSFKKWYRNLWLPKSVEPPYSHITQIGDPILRQKSEPVPDEYIASKQVGLFIDKMVEVLRKYDCVGLAAPQIGVALRIIVLEFNEKLTEEFASAVYKSRQMSTLPLTVVINPTLKVTNYNKTLFPESCASVKGYAGVVERYEEVCLTGRSRTGDELSLDLKGWNARIAQHEMDHLDGRVYTDIMDRTTFSCTCWQAVNARQGRVEIPFTPK